MEHHRQGIKMLRLFVLFAFIGLAGCSATGPVIGTVLVRTDGEGKMSSVTMRESTGNAKMDARVMLFARTTFSARVKNPKPNHKYNYPVTGAADNGAGSVRLGW